jgi:hypothetical protein
LNKVLLKSKNHITIFELNSNSSRVDICKINGESIAYEIKTEFDNFNRLDKQLEDYLQIFEKTYIITTKEQYKKIFDSIPMECGVYLYSITNDFQYKFYVKKKAVLSNRLNPEKQLSVLTIKDLSFYFNIDNVRDKQEIINKIIKDFPPNIINKKFKELIRNKYNNNWYFLINNINNIYELDYQWFFQNNIEPKIIYGDSLPNS